MAARPAGASLTSARLGGATTFALALGLLPGISCAAPWEFNPRITLSETWTDNVGLAVDGQEESEWITELRPGFSLRRDGPRSNVRFTYDLQALWYAEDSERNDVYHQASGIADFIVVPESLFLDTFARYDQRNINPAGRVAVGNLFDTDNRTDALVFGASPYHLGRWGNWGQSELRYSYRGTRYYNTDPTSTSVEESDTNAISAWLGSPEVAQQLSWRASGSYSRTDFDVSPEFEYAQVSLDVGVPVGLRTRLTGTVGRESDLRVDTTTGDLDSSFWYAGFIWAPDERQTLSARAGERYFGTSWGGNYTRRAARGTLTLDYSENPTTSAGILATDPAVPPTVRPGADPTLDARIFLEKRFLGTASYELVRSTIDFRIISSRRIYEDETGGTEKIHGAGLGYSWRMAPRTTLRAGADWERRYFAFDDGRDDRGSFDVRVRHDLTRVFSSELRASHDLRNSDTRTEYRANTISLSVTAAF
jgi:hypothetical protein